MKASYVVNSIILLGSLVVLMVPLDAADPNRVTATATIFATARVEESVGMIRADGSHLQAGSVDEPCWQVRSAGSAGVQVWVEPLGGSTGVPVFCTPDECDDCPLITESRICNLLPEGATECLVTLISSGS